MKVFSIKRYAKIAVTIGIIVQCIVGCRTTHSESSRNGLVFNDNCLLWEITAPSGKHSYVFGTIHVSDSAVFMQRDTVLKVMDMASSFWAEIDLDSAKDVTSGMGLMSKLMLPYNKSLASFYTPEEYVRIKSALEERFGAMASMMERMKPGALVAMMMMDSSVSPGGQSIDEFLWARAKSKGIPARGIERTEEQVEVLDSMPPAILLEAVDAGDVRNTMMDDLLKAYADEDLDHIVSLVDSLSAVESFMLTINDNRNTRMARRLRTVMDTGGAFIAIGTAHLGGSQGFLAELQRSGYRITPVRGGKRIQWLSVP